MVQIRSILKKNQCSHILISDPIDVVYISGFQSSNAYLLISKAKNILFTDFRYLTKAEKFCRHNPSWHLVLIKQQSFIFLKEHLSSNDILGIQSSSITVDQFDTLRQLTRGMKIVKLKELISDVSLIKFPKELHAMKRAASIADKALSTFIEQLYTGITEREAVQLLEKICAAFGSSGPSFPSIVLFGANSALPHGEPSKRTLRENELVLCDFGCVVKGFCSDMTRTFVYGKATNRHKAMYELVLKAQRAGVKGVRVGITCDALDAICRDAITQAGFGPNFGHGTGHGVGRRIHEGPRIGKNNNTCLQADMVITIEPGIYLPRWGGIRIEDMVVVTQNGARSLSHFKREFLEVPCRY